MKNDTAPLADIGMLPNFNYGASIIILKTMYEFVQRADFALDCEQRLYLGLIKVIFHVQLLIKHLVAINKYCSNWKYIWCNSYS